MELQKTQTDKIMLTGIIDNINVSIMYEKEEGSIISPIQMSMSSEKGTFHANATYSVKEKTFSFFASYLSFGKKVYDIAIEQIEKIIEENESNI